MALNYRSPGVYINEVPNAALANLPSGFRIAGLVATGATSLPVSNTAVVKGSANGTDAIPTSPYSTVLSITAIGDVPSLAQYRSGIDYSLVNNSIQWLNGGNQPVTGATYYVSWTRPKLATDYLPTLYLNLNDIRTAYGSELNNGVITPVTVAANLLFQNGAQAVIIAQPLTGADLDIETAINNMAFEDIDVLLCPQATDTTLNSFILQHITTQSSPSLRHERVFITGADGLSDAVTTQANKAQGFANSRWWQMSPPSFVMTFQDAFTLNPESILLPSTYLGSAWAGLVCNPSNDPAQAFTRAQVVGPATLSTFNYTGPTKDYLGSNGITVLTQNPNSGVIVIRDDTTTNLTNVNTATPSIILITDYVKKTLRPLLDKTYIGTKNTPAQRSRIAATIVAFMNNLLANQIIVDFPTSSLSVTQNMNDPRGVLITFSFAPVYPIKYIDITYSLILG